MVHKTESIYKMQRLIKKSCTKVFLLSINKAYLLCHNNRLTNYGSCLCDPELPKPRYHDKPAYVMMPPFSPYNTELF